MPHTRLDEADRARAGASDAVHAIDFSLALVVAASHINRIVVSRIAELAGLKVLAEAPDSAGATLAARRPGMVILDGGADDRECEPLMESLAAQRLLSGGQVPFVILLSTANPAAGQPPTGGTLDAVVAKPITPERLQPLIQSMIDRVRG